ncbi:hypothetical protein IMX23_12250 [Listeria seeligeri]|nr:hypothetical protein [Listeria seeligeri]QPJ27982.1 hypothetical protein IMX23_12250 [Listeria seeligeri]
MERVKMTVNAEYIDNKLSAFGKNIAPKENSGYICAPLVGMEVELNVLFVTDFMGRRFEVNQENGALKHMKIVK